MFIKSLKNFIHCHFYPPLNHPLHHICSRFTLETHSSKPYSYQQCRKQQKLLCFVLGIKGALIHSFTHLCIQHNAENLQGNKRWIRYHPVARTDCVSYGIQRRIKTRGPLFRKYLLSASRQWRQSIKPAHSPSERGQSMFILGTHWPKQHSYEQDKKQQEVLCFALKTRRAPSNADNTGPAYV